MDLFHLRNRPNNTGFMLQRPYEGGECSLVLDRPRDWKLPEQEDIWHDYMYEKPKKSGFYLTADLSGSIHEKFYDANIKEFVYYPYTTRENLTVHIVDTVVRWREMIKYGE